MQPRRFERWSVRLGMAGVAVALAAALAAYLFPRGIEVLRGERGLDLPGAARIGALATGGGEKARLDRVPYAAGFLIPQRPADDQTFRFRPRTVTRDYYPDNPRGYFQQDRADEARLRLEWCGWTSDPALLRRELLRDGDVAFDRIASSAARRSSPWDVALQRNEALKLKLGDELRVTITARAARPKRVQLGAVDVGPSPPALAPVAAQTAGPQWQSFHWEFSPARRDAEVRLSFNVAEDVTPLDVRDVKLTVNGEPPPLPFDLEHPPVHWVEYAMNRWGLRGDDFERDREPGVRRIMILGDSFTFGAGVHLQDVFAHLLEQQLNERGDGRYECLNFGVPGYSTLDERVMYETFASQFDVDVVLLAMVSNDHMPIAEYVNGGDQRLRNESPEANDFRPCVEELRRLRTLVEAQSRRLAAISFRLEDAPLWKQMEETVLPALAEMSLPHMSMRAAPRERVCYGVASYVHDLDGHPNERAHRVAADEIAAFLAREGMLGPAPSK